MGVSADQPKVPRSACLVSYHLFREDCYLLYHLVHFLFAV
jgi:hypothetical protein